MFVKLKDLSGAYVVCNIEDIECVHVGKIDRKGNTATIVKFLWGGYFCVSESIFKVAKSIRSPMFLMLHDDDLSPIFLNIEEIECIFKSAVRKTKGKTIVACRSGNWFVVFDSPEDIYTRLMPQIPKEDN